MTDFHFFVFFPGFFISWKVVPRPQMDRRSVAHPQLFDSTKATARRGSTIDWGCDAGRQNSTAACVCCPFLFRSRTRDGTDKNERPLTQKKKTDQQKASFPQILTRISLIPWFTSPRHLPSLLFFSSSPSSSSYFRGVAPGSQT